MTPDWVLKSKILTDAWCWFSNLRYNFHEKRRVRVRIDPWDVWSMDYTLAEIILPMLERLIDDKHGAPHVDDGDVPEELWATPTDNDFDIDDNHFKRWDYVLDEMVYAFRTKVEEDEVYFRLENIDEIEKEHARIKNGFRLFGKYYESLWT
jgi:hypothetical protein